MTINELIKRSVAIRKAYRELEIKNHKGEWTIDEDLLALNNDVGNLDRLIMTKNGRYYDETPYNLDQKLAENIWWLIEISQRLDIDIESELEKFLSAKETSFDL